jgi:hemerythrin-like metal-binding protein
MARIVWKPEFSVGDPSIDKEHQELIDLVNDTAGAILDGQPDADIQRSFGDLYRAISAHFALEERQMREAKYDQLRGHKSDHERLLDVLRDMMDDPRDDGSDADLLTAALEEWFAGHFREHDSRLHRRLGPHRH